jgi:hypothetical protein
MLGGLFGNPPGGVCDPPRDVSRPVSGAYWFAPSLNAPDDLTAGD